MTGQLQRVSTRSCLRSTLLSLMAMVATVLIGFSSVASAAGAAPGAPTGLTGTVLNASMGVSWVAPTGGAVSAASYRAQIVGGPNYCATTTTSCVIYGLTNGQAYSFTVIAYSATGVAGPVATSSTTTTPAYLPTPPQHVQASSFEESQSTVRWVAPSNTNGAPISGYVVTAAPGGATCVTSNTSCVVTGLTDGTSYTFTVTATNAAGSSSATSNAALVGVVASAPSSVNATLASDTSATVSWTASPATGLSSPMYTATASPGGAHCSTTALSCVVSGLSTGVSYTFSVTATNEAGTSAPSASSPPAIPAAVPGPVQSVVAQSFQAQSSTISWLTPTFDGGSAITGYTATASPGGSQCNTTANSCVLTGLTDGDQYVVSVVATNDVGNSTVATTNVTVGSVAAAPTSVTATSNQSGASDVSWSAATTTGLPVLGYLVTASPGGAHCATTTALACTVSGLTNGVDYTFTVAAYSLAGTSLASAPSPIATPATAPNAPQMVEASSFGAGQSLVSWTAPASDGGSPIAGYVVSADPEGATCMTTTTSCVVSGLTNGQSYTFAVTATNAAGSSSASSNAALPGSIPSAPSGVAATPFEDRSSMVSWTASTTDGIPVDYYTVMAAPGGAHCRTTGTSCLVSGLTNGVTYTFTVTATNKAGTSAPGPEVIPASIVANQHWANAPRAVTSDGANVWVAAQSNVCVTEFSVATGLQEASVCPSGSTGFVGIAKGPHVAVGGNYVWVDDYYSQKIWQIDTATNQVVGEVTTGIGPYGVAADAQYAWVANSGSGTVSKVDATTHQVLATIPVGVAPVAVADRNGMVWVVNAGSNTVSELSSADTTVMATYPTGNGPSAISVDDQHVWITNQGDNTVTELDATTGNLVATLPVGNSPQGVSSDGVDVWVSNFNDGTVTEIDCASHMVVATLAAQAGAFGIYADGTNVWVANYFANSVTQINVGTGTASPVGVNIATPATAPGAPQQVSATPYVEGQSTVSWTTPVDTGGAPLTGYLVTASPGGLTCSASTTTSCTVTGLTDGVSYTFTVTATNAAGSSSASSGITPVGSTPDAPTAVVASAASTTSVLVRFTPSVNDYGFAVSSYLVTASSGAHCTTSGSSCVVSGLSAGGSYTFTVTATNAAGTSAASPPSAVVTTLRR